jgi:hypothetical protein
MNMAGKLKPKQPGEGRANPIMISRWIYSKSMIILKVRLLKEVTPWPREEQRNLRK